ncbi:hypothetical protein YQE_01538, partial [Dendroctonus ponderosae]
MYTSLGVITKGTVIEVNISELGLVTQAGKVVWGKYAQVTNNPENDGCINAVDENGKIHRLRRECPADHCGAGVFMAAMEDRHYCGKCGYTLAFSKQE